MQPLWTVAVTDGRRTSWSAYGHIREHLVSVGISYLYYGYAIGGKRCKTDWPYDELTREAIHSVVLSAHRGTVCLMCAEGDPMRSHRGRDLTPMLEAWMGVEVRHILRDGTLK